MTPTLNVATRNADVRAYFFLGPEFPGARDSLPDLPRIYFLIVTIKKRFKKSY